MEDLIVKKVLQPGIKDIQCIPGTKVVFHFRTTKCDSQKTVIDDSKIVNKPMELVIGKQFKFEVWETVVQKMALNEVAVFTVDKSLVSLYPFVSKILREAGKKTREKRSQHCCDHLKSLYKGVGYDDLNELIRNPQNLEFTIELLQAVLPHEYEKESWQMTKDEKLENIPVLREKGNVQFREKNYEAAANTYAQAIGLVEQLMLVEKPNDTEWLNLNAMKIPVLLNYAQCKLLNKEYYSVIEHCTTVLKYDPENVKALYRRGKAHIGAWNEYGAISDLTRAAQLDTSLQSNVNKELQSFNLAVKERNKIQSTKF